jgi:thiosulfate/3-mercaptopyruvate sulfurtransferase
MCEVFGALGIAPGVQVVVYDDANGMIAARLWWMLRYMGHDAVAVLDGGWQAWCRAGRATEAGARVAHPARFDGQPRRARLRTLDELDPARERLVDARDPARFRGEVEPIDRRAGHIPGARNHAFPRNLDSGGRFLAPDLLRDAFTDSLGTLPDGATVHYCGSGVSACHNVLAQVHAGLPEPRLYCGSWSEWSLEPQRPAATGE